MPKYFRAIPFDTILEDGEYLVQLGSMPGEFKVVGKLCPHPGPKEVKWRTATTKDEGRPCRFQQPTSFGFKRKYGLLVRVETGRDGTQYGDMECRYHVDYEGVLINVDNSVEVEAQ